MTASKNARLKYFAYLELKNDEEKSTLTRKREVEKRLECDKKKKDRFEKILEIDTQIQTEDHKLATVDVLLENSNKTLLNAINSAGKISRTDLIKAQMMLHTGIEESAETKSRICAL